MSPSHAQPATVELPLWEVGVGGFGSYTPDYAASAESNFNGLPFPYLVYRGDFLRLGGESAARLVPFESAHLEVGLSLDAAFGASSSDNPARAGMPDLAELFEIGPELVWSGPRFGSPGQEGRLDFAIQGRAVFSFDAFEIDYQGLTAEVIARYRKRGVLGPKSRMLASIGPIFATEGLQDYFYEVEPAFAQPGRPAYDGKGGYMGTEFRVGMLYLVNDRLALFGSVGGGIYSGAANADSPLFEQEVSGRAALGFTYQLYRSKETVTRRRR